MSVLGQFFFQSNDWTHFCHLVGRFVGTVVVQDLQTGQKWHFLCNAWLAIDIGDCSLDRVFPVSTETDLMRFR